MNSNKQYHQQGDVLLAKVDCVPTTAEVEMSPRFKGKKNRDLAYGESRDHVHEILGEDVTIYKDKDGSRYVHLKTIASLEHNKMSTGQLAEHLPQVVEPGVYKFGTVQEFDCFEQYVRNVVD